MGVFVYEMEIVTPIPPTKFFKGFVLDADTLIPKIVPQAILSIELLEGDGGPGSIKKITFGQGSSFKYAKHRIETVDEENLRYSYSVIEGDALANALEKITYDTKILVGADGGSIIKNTSKYFTIGDFEINEEQVKMGKEKAVGLFKAIEAYLLANPNAC